MLSLAIHTAGPFCGVSLHKGAETIGRKLEQIKRGHDVRLPQLLNDVLDETDRSFSDVCEIGVCVGPGSFTGIRVGVAFARGLGLSLDAPVIGITRLHALCPADLGKDRVIAALPAKLKEPSQTVWCQSFVDRLPVAGASEIPLQDLGEKLHGAEVFVSTEEGQRFADHIIPKEVERCSVSEKPDMLGGILSMGLNPKDYPPSPNYARAPDAVPQKARLAS